jgi:hypothetical protein
MFLYTIFGTGKIYNLQNTGTYHCYQYNVILIMD